MNDTPVDKRETQVVMSPKAAGAKKHDTITMIVRKNENAQQRSKWPFQLGTIIAVVLGVVLIGLFLPPISAYSRYIAPDTSFVALADNPDADGIALGGAGAAVRIKAADAATVITEGINDEGWQCQSLDTLPTYLTPTGTIYSLELNGKPEGRIQAAIDGPAGADLYGYDALLKRWRFVPVSDQRTTFDRLPSCLVWTEAADIPDVIGITANDSINPETVGSVDRVYLTGMHPTRDGQLRGRLPAGLSAHPGLVPVISNIYSPYITDTLTVESILNNPDLRTTHVTQLASFAASDNFLGLAIDYSDLENSAALQERFNRLLLDLSRALHEQDQILVVMLPPDTDLDWANIGQIADELIVKLSPATDTQTTETLAWLTTQVNRYQLFVGIAASNVVVDEAGTAAPLDDELLPDLGQIDTAALLDVYEPGDTVTLTLSGGTYNLERHEATQTTVLQSEDGQSIYLADTSAIFSQLQLADQYQLAGSVILSGDATMVRNAIARYQAQQPPVDMHAVDVHWSVLDAEGNILASESGPSLEYAVAGDDAEIEVVAVANINGQSVELDRVAFSVVTSTPSAATTVPTTEPTTVPTQIAAEPTEAPTQTLPTATDMPPTDAASTPVPTAVAQEPTATPMVFATNTPLPDDSTLPSATPLPTDPPQMMPTSTFAQAVLPPAAEPVEMELGGLVEQPVDTTFDVMRSAGMNWIVLRLPYFNGASPIPEKQRIEDLQELGFKVYYIVVGSPLDFDATNFDRNFSSYLSALANFGADAIQVWDSPDSDLFWTPGDIDPADYVAMLSQASAAIKLANEETLVVSAALLPDDNDELYYQGMVSAGAADVIDCIGVQYLLGTVPPDATTGDARGDDHIYYMDPTLDLAFDSFGGSRPLCLTIGYLSAEGYSPLQEPFTWAANTTDENQAAWLAQAEAINRQSGQVRLMLISNVDFTFFGIDAAAGYAIIRRDGSCPACDTLASQ